MFLDFNHSEEAADETKLFISQKGLSQFDFETVLA